MKSFSSVLMATATLTMLMAILALLCMSGSISSNHQNFFVLAQNDTNVTNMTESSTTVMSNITATETTMTNTTTTTTTNTSTTMSSSITNTTASETTMTTESTTTATTTATTMHTGTMAPPPPPPCSNFTFHLNCKGQNHCQEYNNSCVPKCSLADMNGTLCNMWPHCWWGWNSQQQSYCTHKCAPLTTTETCITSDCSPFNGKCGSFCNKYGNNASMCNWDHKCMWNATQSMCLTKCDLATDDLTCSHVLSGGMCMWNRPMQKCVRSCNDLSADACMAESHCDLFTLQPGYTACFEKCEGRMNMADCGKAVLGCSWNNGKCYKDCPYYTDATSCSWNPACGWWDTSKTCYTRNCSVYGNDTKSCGSFGNYHFCNVGADMMCKNACSNLAWPANETICTMDASCWWNSTTMMCKPKPCNMTMDGAVCNYRPECTWVVEPTQQMGMCKPACETTVDWSLCTSWSHCWWEPSDLGGSCSPRCAWQNTKQSCMGANANALKFETSGPCYWASDSLRCQQGTCADRSRNATACGMTSFCLNKRDSFFDTCVPSCGRALTEMDCNNPFFQAGFACVWDISSMTCKASCAFIVDPVACNSGPCWWNANFSVCTLKRMPPPNATTMTTTSTTMMTESAAATNTTMTSTVANTTQETAASTTSTTSMATNTTTMAATTTTTTTTTAAPKRNPRAQFVLDSVARARPNTTAENFRTQLASLLGVPSSALAVTYEQSTGIMLVEFKEDAKDAAGNAINITAEFQRAVTLNQAQLTSLGAASVTSAEPAPAPTQAAPEDGPDVAVIAGAAAGGFVFLLIILFIIKKQTSAGTGAGYLEDDKPGDRPMLELPQNGNQRHNANML